MGSGVCLSLWYYSVPPFSNSGVVCRAKSSLLLVFVHTFAMNTRIDEKYNTFSFISTYVRQRTFHHIRAQHSGPQRLAGFSFVYFVTRQLADHQQLAADV